jgi:DNA-binding NtrC family response regulator
MAANRPQVTALLDDAPAFSRQTRGGIFLVIQGPDRGESVRLHDRPVYFGSSSDCELTLTDTTVSRKHAYAELAGDDVVLVDNGSTNGTFIGGAKLEKVQIGFGAEFKIGRSVIKFLPDEEIVQPTPSREARFGSIVGGDTTMRQMFGLLTDVAATSATVLIEGETGTGKELIAEEIHNHSPRKNGPFVVFDCGSVPRELIESMLFGHVKGAFTGAIQDRQGLFEVADHGTLFLDEIGEMNLDLQVKLLRVLESSEFRRVGGTKLVHVDVRVVAATNKRLTDEVAAGRFREDLFYRLNVIHIEVPPLRERQEDIPAIVAAFLDAHHRKGLPRRAIAPEALAALTAYPWPGNVRELRNVIERACLLARGGNIDVGSAIDDAVAAVASGDSSAGMGVRTDLPFKEAKGQLVEQFEREYIEDLMRRHKMNLSAASREAQIDRKHLRELMRKYGLDTRAGDADDGE